LCPAWHDGKGSEMDNVWFQSALWMVLALAGLMAA
jgi:hypothetical protein